MATADQYIDHIKDIWWLRKKYGILEVGVISPVTSVMSQTFF